MIHEQDAVVFQCPSNHFPSMHIHCRVTAWIVAKPRQQSLGLERDQSTQSLECLEETLSNAEVPVVHTHGHTHSLQLVQESNRQHWTCKSPLLPAKALCVQPFSQKGYT